MLGGACVKEEIYTTVQRHRTDYLQNLHYKPTNSITMLNIFVQFSLNM